MMAPVELRRDINANLMLCEVPSNHAKRSLVYKQHQPFQVSEHPFCLQYHQLLQSNLPLNLKSRISPVEPKLDPEL